MAGYSAMRIAVGKLDYTAVIARYPQFKAECEVKRYEKQIYPLHSFVFYK